MKNSFLLSVTKSLANSFNFNGGAARDEWLSYFLFFLMASAVMIAIFLKFGIVNSFYGEWVKNVLGFILFFPLISLTYRRLRGVGRGGYYILVAFIPFIGSILVVSECLKSDNE